MISEIFSKKRWIIFSLVMKIIKIIANQLKQITDTILGSK